MSSIYFKLHFKLFSQVLPQFKLYLSNFLIYSLFCSLFLYFPQPIQYCFELFHLGQLFQLLYLFIFEFSRTAFVTVLFLRVFLFLSSVSIVARVTVLIADCTFLLIFISFISFRLLFHKLAFDYFIFIDCYPS